MMQVDDQWVDVAEDNEELCGPKEAKLDAKSIALLSSCRRRKKLTFNECFAHFCARSNASLMHITEFLKILWIDRPPIDYGTLSKTGRTFMNKGLKKTSFTVREVYEPKEEGIKVGKYAHFGSLRSALLGETSG
jgi:hypothetical protein